MILKQIIKKDEGKFLTRYDLIYEIEEGFLKTYEIVSRNNNIKNIDDLCRSKVDAVVMIMHDESNEKILLCREFRMSLGQYIYSFPSGLIENNESAIDCAIRELKEETGLKITKIEILFPESFSAVGICNEKSICLIGNASGTIKNNTSGNERICSKWYTQKEVEEILQNGYISARTQMYCYMWLREHK